MVHSFLRAIGFRSFKENREVDFLIRDIVENPDQQYSATDEDGNEFIEMVKEYDESYGISVCGHYDDFGMFQVEYYYPYFIGSGFSNQHFLDIERHNGRNSYAGICDDPKVGVSFIFYLQNITKYFSVKSKGARNFDGLNVCFSALCLDAKVLLPLKKDGKVVATGRKNIGNRADLVSAARNGDPEAIEDLTLSDMDTYTKITKGIKNKVDLFSMVDTSFVPCSVESDQYMVVGEIIDILSTKNQYTNEEVLLITVECNELVFDLCINREDLLGEPEIGRRIKGKVWMQGLVSF